MAKKKISELSVSEAKNICSKHKQCSSDCPLNDKKINCLTILGLRNDKLPRRYLKKKVEVEQ